MDISFIGGNIVAFIIVLGLLVTVHEYGHFWVARRNGVAVEVFSIGFGPELFGWTDKHGVRWRIAGIPLGGYVKFLGDMNAASQTDQSALKDIPESERGDMFAFKSLPVRAAVVFAGPAANFLLAFVLIFGVVVGYGVPRQPDHVPALIQEVVADSPAAQAGLMQNDEILQLNGQTIASFAQMQSMVQALPGEDIDLVVGRGGQTIDISITLGIHELADGRLVGRMGVINASVDMQRMGIVEGALESVRIVGLMTWQILDGLWGMVTGMVSVEELGGPLRIAETSGEVARQGLVPLIYFAAILSVNLGLLNLLPIPVLDGGHLVMYAYEAVRGRPMGEKAQEISFKIGLGLVLTLMVVATWNDIVRLF